MPEVVIVGGGIAGLAAAFELSRQQVTCVVLERAPRAGGVIFSEQIDGFTIDGGPDSLLVQKPAAIALCQELGLGERLIPTRQPRIAYIQRAGTLYPIPSASVLGIPTRVRPFLASRLFSWSGKVRMGAELFVPPKSWDDDADESIGGFITRRFGREATAYLAEPLLAGIHAGDVDRLSIRALFPQFVEAEQKHGSLLRAFASSPSIRHPQSAIRNPDGAFRSLPGGLSELVDALVRALPSGAVCTNTAVTAILERPGASSFTVSSDRGPSLETQTVILATPAFVTARLTRDLAPDLSELCAAIPYASSATVALGFPRGAIRHPLNGSGFVVPVVEGTGIMAASWLSSKWPHRAPEGRVLLRAFIGGARDPRSLDRSDEDLIDTSLRALTPLLGIVGAPMLSKVYRWERASAQHEVGHLARVAAIDRVLERRPGLFVTGSGFRGVGIPDCVGDGRRTARAATEYLQREQERVKR